MLVVVVVGGGLQFLNVLWRPEPPSRPTAASEGTTVTHNYPRI